MTPKYKKSHMPVDLSTFDLANFTDLCELVDMIEGDVFVGAELMQLVVWLGDYIANHLAQAKHDFLLMVAWARACDKLSNFIAVYPIDDLSEDYPCDFQTVGIRAGFLKAQKELADFLPSKYWNKLADLDYAIQGYQTLLDDERQTYYLEHGKHYDQCC